jgi:hypothetical protein
MNGNSKFHKATGPAFHKGEQWISSNGAKCSIISVRKYPGSTTNHTSDYGVTYQQADGSLNEKDAWSFQVRYGHIADLNL